MTSETVPEPRGSSPAPGVIGADGVFGQRTASMTDLLAEIGPDGRIVAVSPSALTITGHAVPDLVGRPALDFVDPRQRWRVLRHFQAVLRRGAGSARPIELRVLVKSGGALWMEGNPAALPAPGGESAGWIDVLRDVGRRKERDAALVAALATAQAGAAAEAEFLANMSHEIRTPLTSIIGFMQMLKRTKGLGEVQLGHIARVEQASRSLLTVVDHVLDFSKLESGVVQLQERTFSPSTLAEDAVALIRPQALDKNLPVVVDLGLGAATAVVGDPDRLRQVLLNLLSNAVKFTVEGEVRLRVDAHPGDASVRLDFAVQDSGMGIPAEQIPKLFRRYAQADLSIARRFGGTGLGLAISKRLIEAMGGVIEVASDGFSGSRFLVRVTLPRAPVPRPAPTRRSPRARPSLRGKRVLVVEDIPVNQRLVEAILQPLGCTIDLVGSGEEALDVVQAHDHALVLMDMRMPGLGGAETARAIREMGGRFAHLPIIALTADVFADDAQRAMAAGIDAVVTKPIDADHLVATVLAWASDKARA